MAFSGGENVYPMTFKASRKLKEGIGKLATEKGKPISSLLREIVSSYLSKGGI